MQTRPESLPVSKQCVYAIGQFGWSILINIINLQLVYFYIPPQEAGIPIFISQMAFFAVLNALTLLAASGRLFDAITDPIIANLSDNWRGKRGRRMPFLLAGALPAAVFCMLMFVPIVNRQSGWNIFWLFVIQLGFYLFLTVYVTPYFALLPELGHSAVERLNLSTWISITYALGIVAASQVPTLANVLSATFQIGTKVRALQIAIGASCSVAVLLMLVPVVFIDEHRYCHSVPSDVPLFEALKRTFRNQGFRYYVIADFSYFMGLTIVMTGLLYYITVLLGLPEGLMGILMPLMVIVSFAFYPVVNLLAKRFGKKRLVTGAFFIKSVVFLSICFLGQYPISNSLEAYLLVVCYSIPLSFLSILPNAVLADIAEHDALTSGVRQEGMFFAARTLMQKCGQTMGVFIFAALTSLGKNPGDDLGIRLSGIVGFALCLFAGIMFLRYQENRILQETVALQPSDSGSATGV